MFTLLKNSWQLTPINFNPSAAPTNLQHILKERATATGEDNIGYIGFVVTAIVNNVQSEQSQRLVVGPVNIAKNTIEINWQSFIKFGSFNSDFNSDFDIGSVKSTGHYEIYATLFKADADTLDDADVGFIGRTEDLKFNYEVSIPDFSQRPVVPKDFFSSENNYPKLSTIMHQRRLYVGTKEQPLTVFGSRIKEFADFNITYGDDSAFEFTIDSEENNEIISLLTVNRGLFLFTEKAIWLLRSNTGGGINVNNAVNEKESETGVNPAVKPTNILNSIVYLSNLDKTVRGLIPTDRPDHYSTADLGVYSYHLFKDNIVSWTFAGNPHRLLWAVRNDGMLLSCTYAPDHQVAAWSKHETMGKFKDVQSVIEKDIDRVYLIVERGSKHYVERFSKRNINYLEEACPLDASVRYEGEIVEESLQILEGTKLGTTLDAEENDLLVTPDAIYKYTGEKNQGVSCLEEVSRLKKTAFAFNNVLTYPANSCKIYKAHTIYNRKHFIDFINASDKPKLLTVNPTTREVEINQFEITENITAGENRRVFVAGYSFPSRLETLPIVPFVQDGAGNIVVNKPVSINSVSLRVVNSMLPQVGLNKDPSYDIQIYNKNKNELATAITERTTIAGNWELDATLSISSVDQLITVSGIVIDLDYGFEKRERNVSNLHIAGI